MNTNSRTRPWQGTTLAVFAIIGTVLAILFGLFAIFAQNMFSGFFQGLSTAIPESGFELDAVTRSSLEGNGISVSDDDLAGLNAALQAGADGSFAGMLGGMFAVMGVIFLGLGVLYIFISRGLLRGDKWALIVNLIFLILGLLNGLANFKMLMEGQGVISFALTIFLLVLSAQMFQHPYYVSKKA